MVTPSPDEVARHLIAWSSGEQSALDHLMPVVYKELHRLAAQRRRGSIASSIGTQSIMMPERWALVDRLFQLSLSLPPADREVFLRSHCNSDDELYREIQSLLDAHDKARNFLDNPAIEIEARAMATSTARFDVGSQIGPYRVVSRLGTGGMSDVYRAHDTILERDVAIKTLTGDFADDRERLQRARQEPKPRRHSIIPTS